MLSWDLCRKAVTAVKTYHSTAMRKPIIALAFTQEGIRSKNLPLCPHHQREMPVQCGGIEQDGSHGENL
jgi:hypothetical protein